MGSWVNDVGQDDRKWWRDGESRRGEVPEHLCQIPKRTRLREDVHGAELASPVGGLRLSMSREDHDGQIRKSAADTRQHRETVESRHHEIEENAIDRRSFDDIERFDPIKSYENIVSFDAQDLCEDLSNRGIVFDNEYAHGEVPGRSIRAETFARQELTFGTMHGI